MKTQVHCDNCDKYFGLRPAAVSKDSDGSWSMPCPFCGQKIDLDVDDYVLPLDTKVLYGMQVGYISAVLTDQARVFTDIQYEIRFPDSNQTVTVKENRFALLHDWRRLRKDGDVIARVCHYPRNQVYSNVPCYNCVDRTKCNADIFQTLYEYESSGLQSHDVIRLAQALRKHKLSVSKVIDLLDKNHKKG